MIHNCNDRGFKNPRTTICRDNVTYWKDVDPRRQGNACPTDHLNWHAPLGNELASTTAARFGVYMGADCDAQHTESQWMLATNESLLGAVGATWQPTLYTTSKPLTNEESPPLKSYPSSPKRKRVFQIAREVVVERLAEMPEFYDVSEALDEVKESVFIDQCHISPVGNQAIAAAIVNRLLAARDANLQAASSKTRPWTPK